MPVASAHTSDITFSLGTGIRFSALVAVFSFALAPPIQLRGSYCSSSTWIAYPTFQKSTS